MAEDIIGVPETVEDMLPPWQSSLITEAANFIRSHWEEIRPYYEAMSGITSSKHGSYRLDEAAYTFKVKQMAEDNGYALLGQVSTYKLWKALRYGYKRNTGVKMKLLEKQYKRLQITHQPAK